MSPPLTHRALDGRPYGTELGRRLARGLVAVQATAHLHHDRRHPQVGPIAVEGHEGAVERRVTPDPEPLVRQGSLHAPVGQGGRRVMRVGADADVGPVGGLVDLARQWPGRERMAVEDGAPAAPVQLRGDERRERPVVRLEQGRDDPLPRRPGAGSRSGAPSDVRV